MQKVGTTTERKAFEAALRRSHTRRITVSVTNLDGHVLSTLTPVLVDGQVVVDYDAETTRAATLTFLDPSRALNFDTDSPDDGAVYADRMIRITYSVHVEALGRYVSVVIFHGPVTKLDRSGDVVNLEAQGKETLARGAIWRTLSLKKGSFVTTAIKMLLHDRAGETRFSFVNLPHRLPKTRSLDRYAEIWATARSLAHSVNRQLYYDGAGTAILRAFPRSVLYTFSDGTGGDVVGEVQVSYSLDDVKNVVVVVGGKPKGAKHRVRATATAPSSHPLSPARLGPSGNPRRLVEVMEDDSVRSVKAAKQRAHDLLDDRLREVVEVTFDALPVPHLDPGDLVRIKTEDFTTSFRLRRFSIPLGSDSAAAMPVGYLKRTTPNRKRIRR